MMKSTSMTLSARAGIFDQLGVVGFSSIEAPLLAALATDSPLLLIGPHGTAKSLLLNKIAEALDLSFRHYNASLLNFDDLVGFPLPSADGTLQYVKTPAAIWGAGAVIFDEISRCRPDIQNKLFPIIHERKVQGLPLVGLQYRWAAMNPPDRDEDDSGYLGSEPLDTALADRFPFVIDMPAWRTFTKEQQLEVIQSEDQAIDPVHAQRLVQAIARTKSLLALTSEALEEGMAAYVQTMFALLLQAGIALSPRRCAMLYRACLSVNAAAMAIDSKASVTDTTLLALRSSLPQRALGIAISEVKLLSAHKEAMRLIQLAPNDPFKAILCESDPVEKIRLAVAAYKLPKPEFSRVIADALAQLPLGGREAAIVHLFETGAVGRLNAAVASQAGDVYKDIVVASQFSETIHASNGRFITWNKVKSLLAGLNPQELRDNLQANTIATLFAQKKLATPEDAEAASKHFVQTDKALRFV
jgi:MoxR-like ATPase